MGVAEHIFDVDIHGKTVTWHLFDVGGARGQRHSWVPYFDDANAIIFVAPVSAFDQVYSSSFLISVATLFLTWLGLSLLSPSSRLALQTTYLLTSRFISPSVSGGRSEDKQNR
jgi:hypothetical protein